MKPEPLTKEKKKKLFDLGYWFHEEDVKSAVQWFLKEIEKKSFVYEYWEGQGYLVVALQDIKDLIKKAFEVIEDGM